MIRKTLLGKGIGIILSTALVLGLGGCNITLPMQGQVEEVDETVEQQPQKTDKKVSLADQIEAIGSAYYLGENEILIIEFEKFLQEKSISKEKILEYLRRQEVYNNVNKDKNKLIDYFSKKERNIFGVYEEEVFQIYSILQ